MKTPPLSRDAIEKLTAEAKNARQNAYSPHSGFQVGAALLTADGRMFPGVNVENSSYGLTICAERVAVCSAVAAGTREFTAIAVATPGGHGPCGACRQFLSEFGDGLPVLLIDTEGNNPPQWTTVGALLPGSFRLPNQH